MHHTNCYQIPVTPLLKNELGLSFPTRHTSRQVICKGRKGRWCPVLGWVKARTACSQTLPQPSLAITPGVQGLASRGASFPSCSGQTMVTAALTWPVFARCTKGFVPWLLPPARACGWLSILPLLAQGKPQGIQRFGPDRFILSAFSCHLHFVQKTLIGNFIRHPFNSFNSSVSK